jgi:hypothetical protein
MTSRRVGERMFDVDASPGYDRTAADSLDERARHPETGPVTKRCRKEHSLCYGAASNIGAGQVLHDALGLPQKRQIEVVGGRLDRPGASGVPA